MNLTTRVFAACLAMALATSCGRPTPADGDAAGAEIKQMIAKYAASIDEADTKLGGEVWANTPDVTFIHPMGHEHGWEEVKRDVYEKLMGGMFSERKLSPSNIVVHVYGDAAWAEYDWHFFAKARGDGSKVETSGRETQIYRKTGVHRWVLVHVHYSAMPA
jgi:ketosteroid isomerase-like protein